MKGKLSWMVISIIGGVIVTVGILVFFGFFSGGTLEMLISSPAVKAYVQLASGINKAETTGGSVLPGWSLDWTDCYHLSHQEYSGGSIETWCDFYYSDSASKHYWKKGYSSANVIFILNQGDIQKVSSKLVDRESKDTLSVCKDSSYCLCLAQVRYYDRFFSNPSYDTVCGEIYPDFKISYKKGSQCYFGTVSFITNGKPNDEYCQYPKNCNPPSYYCESYFARFLYDISKIKMIQCLPIKMPLKINGNDLKAIQHFEGIIYLNRVKSSKGYYIKVTYSPRERSSEPPWTSCALIK